MRIVCALLILTRALAADALTDRVDAVFRPYNSTASPGCALAVIKDNKIVYQHGYGMADFEHNIPISPTSNFYIGSTSKQFTAFSILLLAQRHQLSLTDDIRKYIPEFPDYGWPIAIRNLLNHTSGIRDYNTLLALSGRRTEDAYRNQDVLDIALRQKALNFRPGTQFLYSNTGYTLLSIILERITAMPLSQFAAKNIFEPLGMSHTHIHDNLGRLVPDRAMGYLGTPPALDVPYVIRTGAGGVMTTLADLLLWDQNFYDAKLGGPDLVRLMQQNTELSDGHQIDYAFGLFVRHLPGLQIVDHDGALGGYRASLTRFPDQRLSIACLCNQREINSGQLALSVAEIYLNRKLPSLAPPPPPPPAAKTISFLSGPGTFAGDYFSEDLDITYRLRDDAGKYKVSIRGVPYQEWSVSGPNELSGPNCEVHFDGSNFRLSSGRVKDLLFRKISP